MSAERVVAWLDALIQRVEAGESIDFERELMLLGSSFVADTLDRQRSADDEFEQSIRAAEGRPVR